MTLQVGTRWAEYSEQEHAQLASLAFDMLTRGEVPGCTRWTAVELLRPVAYTVDCMPAVGASSDSWSVKSKAALLLALVVKRQGQQLWQALQPQLLPLAQQGPVQAEMVGDWSAAPACTLYSVRSWVLIMWCCL